MCFSFHIWRSTAVSSSDQTTPRPLVLLALPAWSSLFFISECPSAHRLWQAPGAKIQRFLLTTHRLNEPQHRLEVNCTQTFFGGGLSTVYFKSALHFAFRGVWVLLECSHMRKKKCWLITLSLIGGLKGTKCAPPFWFGLILLCRIVVDLKEEMWYQKCHDPECKNFRSSSRLWP